MTSSSTVGRHAAWAMAVGGMVGGGMYTLVGLIVSLAGPLAWLSILIGAAIAMATVHSYAGLTRETNGEAAASGIPITIFAREGHHGLAGKLAWWLLAVYVLALAVYTFTAGHYLGNALGLEAFGIAVIEIVMVAALVVLNIRGVENPIAVQVAAVWLQLIVLAALAIIGLTRFSPEQLRIGVPAGSVTGVLHATAVTFVAFEGFEMIAYDLQELRRPRRVMARWLPLAILVVAAAYVLVTLGAASLVGAATLVQHREAALAVAGYAIAGTTGMIAVTIAACIAALTAINATLFSAARLARTTAQHGLLPRWCASCNQQGAPTWATLLIGGAATVVAIAVPLEMLVGFASLGFLALFCVVNVLAVRRTTRRRWIAVLGALGSAGGVIAIVLSYIT